MASTKRSTPRLSRDVTRNDAASAAFKELAEERSLVNQLFEFVENE
jgi:hypothetical protein